jgi:hypothetical protein
MSTQVPIMTPSIPLPTGEIEGNSASILAMKMNIEIAQGTRGIVRASSLHGPSAVSTAINAALHRVNNAP